MAQETEDERLARLTQEVGVDPTFYARQADALTDGDYLLAAHESSIRSLAVIDLRLAMDDAASAKELVTKLRSHLDTLWALRVAAAGRSVNP
jgi:hypothetical protein